MREQEPSRERHEKLALDVGGTTRGYHVPNQDAMFADEQTRSFGVFDGVGGYHDGNVAAGYVKQYCEKRLKEFDTTASPEKLLKKMAAILIEAHENLAIIASAQHKKMGTTATMVKIIEGNIALIVNVGDSRVYLQHEKMLKQITLDDHFFGMRTEEKTARALQTKLNNAVSKKDLTDEEYMLFLDRNKLVSIVGEENIKPRTYAVSIAPGDTILLTTDGIHGNLTDNELNAMLAKTSSAQDAVEQCIRDAWAISRSTALRAKPDDMTAIVVRVT